MKASSFPTAAPEQVSARRRLLDTATRLFYAEGIHAVGIDRIIAEAGVAKATFYNHFPSKDDLVLAYIEEQDRLGRAAVAALPKQPPREMIAAIMGRISEAVVAGGLAGLSVPQRGSRIPRPGQPRAAGHRCAPRMVSRRPPGPSCGGWRSRAFRHRLAARRRYRTACWKPHTWMIRGASPPLSGKR